MSNLPKEVREAMARVIYELEPFEVSGEYIDGFKVSPDGQLSWANVVTMAAEFDDDPVLPYRTYVNDCYARADAAISALGQAGYALAKIEPTQAMVNAARATQYDDKSYSVLRVWDAMLAASQEGTE